MAVMWYQAEAFKEKVEQEIYRSYRYEVWVSLIMISFDRFSEAARDQLNQEVQSNLRLLDLCGVIGEGEFAICLPHTDKQGGAVVAERLRKALAEYSPRISVVQCPEDGISVDELIQTGEILNSRFSRGAA